jgi:hypothetical protein
VGGRGWRTPPPHCTPFARARLRSRNPCFPKSQTPQLQRPANPAWKGLNVCFLHLATRDKRMSLFCVLLPHALPRIVWAGSLSPSPCFVLRGVTA